MKLWFLSLRSSLISMREHLFFASKLYKRFQKIIEDVRCENLMRCKVSETM